MKHNIYILFTLLFATIFTSCTDDLSDYAPKECVVGKPVYATLDFGNGSYEDVTITTRTTFDGTFEHLVRNMYVLVFKETENSDGEKVYGRFFDVNNKEASLNDVKTKTTTQCWAVEPATTDDTFDKNGYKNISERTHGTIRLKTPSGGPYNIYVIANIQAAYLDLSPELFDGFEREDQMTSLFVNLENSPIDRTAMLMTGSIKNVYINEDGTIRTGNTATSPLVQYNKDAAQDKSLKLQRLDAKIDVRIHVDPTRNNPNYPEYDINANKVKDFIPEKWQVVNLTNRTKIVDDYNAANSLIDPNENKVEYYYNSSLRNFEDSKDITVTTGDKSAKVTEHSFSFYMLENHQKAQEQITDGDYHKRDMRYKNQSGQYDTSTGRMWQYAPERGTYLKITGQVVMDYSETNNITGKAQTLYADVTYYIHLGNFTSDKKMDDYDVLRNTRYTYTISIVDVNKIIVEVRTSQPEYDQVVEDQTGAAGDVFIAKQKICLFDAHYGQDVLCFYADDIEEKLTYYVETPFNKQGGQPEDGISLDYRWVKFARNLIKDKAGNVVTPENEQTNTINQHYSKYNRWYLGDQQLKYNEATPHIERLMYVDQLIEYLKKEKEKLLAGEPNDFRKETIKYGNTNKPVTLDVIYVTAFVDDYYYDVHPFSGQPVTNLWTTFVNDCGNRMMHILCDSKRSKDKESTYTNSVFTIRQTPIQTIYNTEFSSSGNTPYKAWGCETVDENGVYETGKGLKYGQKSGNRYSVLGSNDNDLLRQNNNDTNGMNGKNGLYNTWNMCNFEKKGRLWSTYLKLYNSNMNHLYWELPESYDADNPDYVQPEDNVQPLKDNIHFIKDKNWLYSFLVRNRDSNGDGNIDKNEIKWYIASIDQLQMLFIGSEGMSGEAQIYPDKYASASATANSDGVYPWRLHIISSTITAKGLPTFLWAEEGLSVSYSDEWSTPGIKGMRCVRNLGIPDWQTGDIPPLYDEIIEMTVVNDHMYFDASRMNRKSLRGGGSIDPFLATLQPTDEYGLYSLLPLGFMVDCKTVSGITSVKYYNWTGRNGTTNYAELKDVLDEGREMFYPERTNGTPQGSWRMPNIREMALVYIKAKSSLPGDYLSPTTYYSLGMYGSKKKGVNGEGRACWFINNDRITMDTGQVSKQVQFILVKDWDPSTGYIQ